MIAAFFFHESFPTGTITGSGRGEWTERERDETVQVSDPGTFLVKGGFRTHGCFIAH